MKVIRNVFFIAGLIAVFSAGGAFAQTSSPQKSEHVHTHGEATVPKPQPVLPRAERRLPALPVGVTHLEWNEFFVTPLGPKGLERSEKLKSLDGKKVRLLGYMVQREEPSPGAFLLTSSPLTMEEHEGGYSDLPPNYVRVLVPKLEDKIIPQAPRPLLLIGTLSVGNREEKDGSFSMVRLTVPPNILPKPVKKTTSKKP